MTEEIREAYLLLELEPGVSLETVRIAYRELIKIWHPDRFPDDPKFQERATQKAGALNEAYRKTTAYLAANCREASADATARAAARVAGRTAAGVGDGALVEARVRETEAPQPWSFPPAAKTPARPRSRPAPRKRTKWALCLGILLGAACVVFLQSKWDRDHEFAALKSAAEAGDAPAQSLLGAHYESGDWVHRNPVEASRWYRQAAEQGYAQAQCRLARMYHLGLGVPPDQGEAIKWLSQAANQGESIAQNDLGLMYHNGNGVARDDVEAYKWFSVATDRGNTNAARERDGLLLLLTPGQFAEGRRRAVATEFEQEFYDKYPDLRPYRSLVNVVASSVVTTGYQDESREARMAAYAKAARAELQRRHQPMPEVKR